MKAGVILGQQLAVQAGRFLETIDMSSYPVAGGQMHIRQEEAAGVCYLCALHGHTSVDCPRLKSGEPQVEAERVGKWYQSTVSMWKLSRLYKIWKEPIHDPGATRHHQAGTGKWHCDTTKRAQKRHYKKVAKYKKQCELARQQAQWRGDCQPGIWCK